MTTALPDLLDPSALERCAAEGGLDRLLAGWSARLAGAASGDDELRRVVLAALRLDLALIVRAPELLFPCVYNRVYWHGSAEAVAFSGAGADLGAPLRAWVERWRAARGRRGAWARSLRPPEFPLVGALREEYRGALQGKGPPAFSRDGAVVGCATAPALAWERATGRALPPEEAAQRLDASGPQLELEWLAQSWGRARVRERHSKALVVDVDVDGGSKFECVAGLADGTGVFVAGWCDDYDGVIARVDLPGKQVRWRVEVGSEVHALACDAAGTLVAASDGAAVYLLDGTSGATLASVPLQAHTVALVPDGSVLASGDGALLRVWDVAALRRERPTRIRGAHDGWIDACFSPDGQRLLTGELLCDGRDGRLIARLDLDGPGYLEGGPPQHGRMLADDRFVEMAPGRGVCLWNTRDGAQVLADRSRRYTHRHEIVLSPDARWYVHGRRQGSPRAVELWLCAVDDGKERAALGVGDPDCVVFTPDSRRLLVADAGGLTLWWVSTGARETRLAHPAEITGVAVAHDGSVAVTGARDDVLRVWDLARAELRGARPLTADDPTQSSYGAGGEESRTWRATPEALARLEGWLGFNRMPHGRTVRQRDGLTEIVEAGRVIVRMPAQQALVADRSGTRWAFRAEHFAVEDEAGE
ncbi:WD40 repeat domain-containing protein [Nannocystis radixulma]|uniref:WD40 repeat domain-containing protein n=1 Tax=Nannocystis radixulma TaxID=2995305 RepID=A0ABT5AZH8_9BACT|nr:hypothetical protein [Nannocystis radixulma]MDC0667247.1 hypothetical protein [Nannocystis radixulma]